MTGALLSPSRIVAAERPCATKLCRPACLAKPGVQTHCMLKSVLAPPRPALQCSAGARRAPLCRSSSAAAGGAPGPEPEPTRVPAAPAPAAAAATAAAAAEQRFLGLTLLTWKKAIPLGLMFFCILFNYTTLRNTKDVLVVTAPGSGAEVIPFLKTLDLPMAVLFTLAYTTLANRLTPDHLFYACLWPFIAFFGLFGFLVYPNKEALHPTALCDHLASLLGPRLSAPVALLRSWTYAAFYLVAEMWGSIVVSLLFWGLANSVMSVDEAATFYPLFGMGANLALIVAGGVTHRLSEMRAALPAGVDGWGVALQALMGLVVVNGALITGLHAYLQAHVVPQVQAQRAAAAAAGKGGAPRAVKKPRANMSVGESFRFLASSPYIRDLATMVVSFAVALQLVEVTWKSKLKAAYPAPADYSAFMGHFSEAVGVATLGMMLLGKLVLRRWGWGVAALATPAVILVTAVLFMVLVLSEGVLSAPLAALGTTPLAAAVLVGSLQNVFSRSAKYSFFDPCKEMAYIPLDDEIKSKGKAAVDVVGNLLGKSGGAVIQQAAIFSLGSLSASTPYLGAILTLIILNWMRSVKSLEKQFLALMGHLQHADAHADTHAAPASAAAGPAAPAAAGGGNGSDGPSGQDESGGSGSGSGNGTAAAAAPSGKPADPVSPAAA